MSGECYEHDIKWYGDSDECPMSVLESKLVALEADRKYLLDSIYKLWSSSGASGLNNKKHTPQDEYHLGKSDAYLDVVGWIETNVPNALKDTE